MRFARFSHGDEAASAPATRNDLEAVDWALRGTIRGLLGVDWDNDDETWPNWRKF